MHINFTPQVRKDRLTLSKSGDVLIINGESFDFSDIPEGGELAAENIPCDFIIGKVERINGSIRLKLILPHAPEAPKAARFPAPLIDPPDGDLEVYGDDNVEA